MATFPFYRLIIDTSSEHCLMGIAQDGKILSSLITLHANQLSQTLIPSLQKLLQESGLKLSQLNEIAVGIGPGSYTGTRVGVSIAKSLSFALKTASLRGFCSLLAFLPPLETGSFAAVMPSKTGDFYLLKGTRSEGKLSCSQSTLLSQDELTDAIADVDTLVGKPLKDIELLLPSFKGKWTQPNPTLEAVLEHLETAPAEKTPIDLIYLHKP